MIITTDMLIKSLENRIENINNYNEKGFNTLSVIEHLQALGTARLVQTTEEIGQQLMIINKQLEIQNQIAKHQVGLVGFTETQDSIDKLEGLK